jgi:hypothetical protein
MLPRAGQSDETHQEEGLIPHEDLQAEIRDLIAEFKEMTERTLAAVGRAKAGAQEAGLLDAYQAAVRREQQLIDTLKGLCLKKAICLKKEGVASKV